MTTALSTKGGLLLEDLPRYYANDRAALAVIDTIARELQRVEDFLSTLRAEWTPQNSSDTYDFLCIWESILGLPVDPVGATALQRQNNIIATLRKRKSGSGSDWVQNVTTALGSSGWSHSENTPGAYQLTITLPNTGSYNVGTVSTLLRATTPAHLALVISTGAGFVVDVSLVDLETI